MSGADILRANQRLAAAASALADHEHRVTTRARLVADVAAWNEHVARLAEELQREELEAEALAAGVVGFLFSLLGDERLSQEQREAVAASVRLSEAVASRNQLASQLAELDAQLARQSHAQLVAALETARVAKEAALRDLGGPTADRVAALAARTEAIDIELMPLEDAVRAGTVALEQLVTVIRALERARDAELAQTDARGMAGAAQARITSFQRAIDGLSVADDSAAPLSALLEPTDRTPFVDGWLQALVGRGNRDLRLATARATMIERHDRVVAQLGPIRTRHDELARRRSELVAERDALVPATLGS